MLVTWQIVAFSKEQSQVTLFSVPLTLVCDVQLCSPLHGSTLKSQSFFPRLSPMSFKASTICIMIIKQLKQCLWVEKKSIILFLLSNGSCFGYLYIPSSSGRVAPKAKERKKKASRS